MQAQFGVIQCISDFWPCISETASHLVKTLQNLSVWGKNLVYIVLLTVKCSSVVWGHSVQFWFSATLYLKNQSSYIQIRPKFQPQRQVFRANRVLITVKCSRSVWGHLVHFHFWRPCVYFWLKFSAIVVLYTLPVFFYLASHQAEYQGPWASYFGPNEKIAENISCCYKS